MAGRTCDMRNEHWKSKNREYKEKQNIQVVKKYPIESGINWSHASATKSV